MFDSSYADAWACLCHAYLHEHRLGFNPRSNLLDRALDAARKITMPGYYWTQIVLATIYPGLGRQSEAQSAL
jgi:hypothetical protein